MRRREFIQKMTVGGAILLLPARLRAQELLRGGNEVSLKCLGTVNGPRFLDGRTANSTVGLAKDRTKQYSGTKWRVGLGGGRNITLKCMGTAPGAPWLDGRTQNGTVGLAPGTALPYSGTRWEVVPLDANNPNIVALRCPGKAGEPRYLDGRTADGSVGLSKTTDPPFTGTRWEVEMYPVCIDPPCP
jgi:hypothetical protein